MNTVVNEIYSNDGQYKAVISHRQDDLYLVETFHLTREVEPGYGDVSGEYWEPMATHALTESLENATRMAVEELQALSGQARAV